jgi:hypothetical protein
MLGKTFEALNQSCTKPLDDFDTTWLVAPHGTADLAAQFRKYSKYFEWAKHRFTQSAVACRKDKPVAGKRRRETKAARGAKVCQAIWN